MILQIGISWLLENPEIGWVGVVLYLMWEIRGPRGKIASLTNMITNLTTVVRCLARTDDNIDTKQVDDYLVENGMEPGDFIKHDNPTQAQREEVDTLMKKPEDRQTKED